MADIDQERVESLCSPEAVQVAIKLRDLLNGSVRINPEDSARFRLNTATPLLSCRVT